MVNMTVVNKKDILKYGIITIVLFFLFMYSNFVSKEKTKINIEVSKIIDNEKTIGILEENVSVLKQVNKTDNSKLLETTKEINPLKLVFNNQLAMINNIVEKQEVKEKDKNKEKIIKDNKEEVEHAKTGLETEVLKNNVPEKFTNSYNEVYVRNETEYQLTEEMLTPNVSINNKNILIFHTHTCESYTPSENFNYEQTGTYRTTDLNYNVARVGLELKKQLTSYGYNASQDTTYHDYPAYNGSYGRSLETVENILKQSNNTDIVIDIHRDAIGDYSYAPTVKIGEDEAAQLMFVIGTDGGGLEHPNWNENLKFAIKIQEKANELYPGLFKPIILRNSRYNQHLAKGACIIEVGATGNTMDQCLNSMKYLAKVIDEVIK